MSDLTKMTQCKLNKKGSGFDICYAMEECQRLGLGNLEIGTRTRFDDLKTRMVLVAGRFKEDKVRLNFCPFCGGKIHTKFEDKED